MPGINYGFWVDLIAKLNIITSAINSAGVCAGCFWVDSCWGFRGFGKIPNLLNAPAHGKIKKKLARALLFQVVHGDVAKW